MFFNTVRRSRRENITWVLLPRAALSTVYSLTFRAGSVAVRAFVGDLLARHILAGRSLARHAIAAGLDALNLVRARLMEQAKPSARVLVNPDVVDRLRITHPRRLQLLVEEVNVYFPL